MNKYPNATPDRLLVLFTAVPLIYIGSALTALFGFVAFGLLGAGPGLAMGYLFTRRLIPATRWLFEIDDAALKD